MQPQDVRCCGLRELESLKAFFAPNKFAGKPKFIKNVVEVFSFTCRVFFVFFSRVTVNVLRFHTRASCKHHSQNSGTWE